MAEHQVFHGAPPIAWVQHPQWRSTSYLGQKTKWRPHGTSQGSDGLPVVYMKGPQENGQSLSQFSRLRY